MRTGRGVSWLAAALTAALLPLVPAAPAAAAVGAWAPGPAMADGHVAAVPIDGGRVLVVGGEVPEVFSSATGRFERTADNPAGLRPAVAVRLTDGRVLAAADRAALGPPGTTSTRRDAELFEPTTGLWTQTGSMISVHQHALGVATDDNRALVLGRPGHGHRTTAETFSGLTGTWSAAAAPAADHERGSLVLLASGDVLLAGGTDNTPGAEIWSPATGVWRPAAAPPFSFCDAASARLHDGNVLFTALKTCSSTNAYSSRETLLYDVEADRWRSGGTARVIDRALSRTVVLPDGRVLLVGSGYLPADSGFRGVATDEAELYDPGTDLWSSAGSTPRAHSDNPATSLPDGRVLVTGANPDLTATDVYSPPATTTPVTTTTGGPAVELHGSASLRAAYVGRDLAVVGRLLRADTREPVPGEVVELHARADGADSWTTVGSARTDASGSAVFRPTFTGRTTYALRHPGSATAGQSVAPDLVVTAAAAGPPSEPARVEARTADGGAEISWAAPHHDGGADVTGYVVTVGGQTLRATAGSTRVLVSGLSNGTSHRAAVRAVNASGEGPEAATTVVPRAEAPAASTGTVLCGTVEGQLTLTASSSPYRLCPVGLTVPTGSALILDASGGPLVVRADGSLGLRVIGGDLRTVGTAPDRRISIEPGQDPSWEGIRADPRLTLALRAAPAVDAGDLVLTGARTPLVGSSAVRVALRRSTITTSAAVAGPAVDSTSSPLRLEAVSLSGPYSSGISASSCSATCRLAVVDSAVHGMRGVGVSLRAVHQPVLQRVRVTGSGRGTNATAPAVVLQDVTASYGPGRGVDGLTGGGNGIDAAVLSGTVTADLPWVSPTNSDSEHPLGYLLGSLRVPSGVTVDVPSGGVVKAVASSCTTAFDSPMCPARLLLEGGALRAVGGGAVLTSAADPAVGPVTCPSTIAPACLPDAHRWSGIVADGAASLQFTDATLRHAEQPIRADGSAAVSLTGGALEHGGRAVTASWQTSLAVDGTLFRGFGSSRSVTFGDAAVDAFGAASVVRAAFRDVHGDALRVRGNQVRVTDSTFDHVVGRALDARGAVGPVLQRLTFRNGGSLSDGSATASGYPVLDLTGATFGLGPGQQVDELSGAGNAVPAVALGGTVTSDVRWVTPQPSDVLRPLGYYLGSQLTVAESRTLTLPAGAIVAAASPTVHEEASLLLRGASLDASAGGALLTSTTDPALSGTGLCGSAARPCSGPRPWAGIGAQPGPGGETATLTLDRATVRDGRLTSGSPYGPGSYGAITVTGSVLERTPVRLSHADSLTVDATSVTGAGVRAAGVTRVRVTGSTVQDAPGTGIDISRDISGPDVDLALQRNTVTRSGRQDRNGARSPAIAIRHARVTVGPGQQVDANTGADNPVDAIAFIGAVIDSDVTWVSVRNQPAPHPLGYLVADPTSSTESLHGSGLTVAPGRTLTLPRNAVMKVEDRLVLDGARLDAGAGGATITTSGDDSVAPTTCGDPTRHACRAGTLILERSSDGRMATAALAGATVGLRILDRSGATSSPSDPAHGLSARHVRLAGLRADPSAVSVTDAVSTGEVAIAQTVGAASSTATAPRSELVNLVVTDAPEGGITVDRTSARVDGVTLRRNGFGADGHVRPALRLVAATGLFRCLDVQDNSEGVYVSAPSPVTVAESVLNGNAGTTASGWPRYDANAQTLLQTTGVFWGQAGGPRPEQVGQPQNHVDVAPAATAPMCAGAAPAVPPKQPTAVTATRDADGNVLLSWTAPTDSGGTPLTGYLVTTGTGRELAVAGTSVSLAADPSGPHHYDVRAVNGVAAGPPATVRLAALEPAPSPSSSPTPSPTSSPSPSPSTSAPSPSPSPSPSAEAAPSPTSSSTSPSAPAPGGGAAPSESQPAASPTPASSVTPSPTPTPTSTSQPAATPSGSPTASAPASPGSGTAATGSGYVGLPGPVRVLDTRENRGARRSGAIVLDLSDRILDPSATSAVLNVTVTGASARGFLVAYPTGTTRPGTSNVNFGPNETQANEVVVALPRDRRVTLHVDSASAHVIADLVGAFTLAPDAGRVVTTTPSRAFDSRDTATPRRRGEVVVDLAGRLPAGSTDVVLNVTVTRPSARGFITVFPTGATRPGTSNVNFEAGQTQANEVVTRVGTGRNAGRVSLFVDSADAALIVDVVGAVTSSTGAGAVFTALSTPVRALDTRDDRGARRSGEVQVRMPTAVPADALGVIVNVTATNGTRAGFVTVFPTGAGNPGTSNVNFPTGRTQANEVVSALGSDLSVTLSVRGANAPAAHLIVDVVGYLTG